MLKTSFQMQGKYLQVFVLDELYSDIIDQIQKKILEMIDEKEPKGVLLDVSMLNILDSFSTKTIINTLKMIDLIGPKPVLIGLKPETISYLTQINFDFGNVFIAKHINEGLEFLNKIKEKKEK